MPDIDERQVLRHAASIARLEPSGDSTDRAMQRTRSALARVPSERGVHVARRFVLPASVAAGLVILIGVGALFLGPTEPQASAAELFKEVVEATGAYRGWIHITGYHPNEFEGGPERLRQSIGMHVNTADGTYVTVDAYKNALWVKWHVPSREETRLYHSQRNVISVGRLSGSAAERMTNYSWPTSFVSLVDLLEREGPAAFEVRRTEAGQYDRFDISRTNVKAGIWPGAFRALTDYHIGDRFTLWTDRRTRRIERIEFKDKDGQAHTRVLSYGEPYLNDMYDLGVPRDALVVERRITPAAQDALDRIDRRIEQGLGDYVALLIESHVNEDGTLSRKGGALRLYIQNGDACLVYKFVRGDPERVGRMRLPGDWPDADIDEVLALAREAYPRWFFVDNGTRAWQGFVSGEAYDGFGEIRDAGLRFYFASFEGLPGNIWFGSNSLETNRPGASVQLLVDENRPGLIGLENDYLYEGDRTYRIVWIDPARYDMPIERITRGYEADGETVRKVWHTRYIEHAQLPNGQWYPTRWRQGDDESRLRVYPDMQVDRDWFMNPAELLENRRAADSHVEATRP